MRTGPTGARDLSWSGEVISSAQVCRDFCDFRLRDSRSME
nr:hypothetical protein [Kibdelosporangium sp. MJ126-NF4]